MSTERNIQINIDFTEIFYQLFLSIILKKKKDETLTTLIFFFQMGLLIEELGLTQVLSTRVGRLTTSELKRLSIACCLMSSADILLLDSPTIFMDIFDTFFLVEFLRGWASGGPGNMELSTCFLFFNIYTRWCALSSYAVVFKVKKFRETYFIY